MKNVQVGLLALLLYTAGLEAKTFKKNVPTYEIGSGAKVNGNKITYDDPDCDDGLDCMTTKTCSKAGYTPSLSEDKKYFACCAEGQRLLGSPDTAFDCCAEGHDLVGDSHCGYHCCATGFSWDGKQCKKVCDNGKALVDGKCVCPKGITEGDDGTCKKTPDEPRKCDDGECSSGLESGKCYLFKDDNGYRLGLGGDGNYYAAADSMTQRYGKFQLCLDEKCTPGKPINPSTEIYIRDTYGDLATGANKNEWLNHGANGIHISRTPLFSQAGHFSISKWPCGKYCLSGFTEGIGPACPAITPALTFYSQDPNMCVEFEFTEVPCDLKSDANNCIWKSGDQCCNKVDCSKPNCSKKENASNSSTSNSPLVPSSPDNPTAEAASTDSISSDTSSSPEDASPNDSSPDDTLQVNPSPDNTPPSDATPENSFPDDGSPDTDSPALDTDSLETSSPEIPRTWSNPLSYGSTPLLTAAGLLLSAILSRFPKQKLAQMIGLKHTATQADAPATKGSDTQVTIPEEKSSEEETPEDNTPEVKTPEKVPEEKIAEDTAPEDKAIEVVDPWTSQKDVARVSPETEDIGRFSPKMKESMSRHTTSTLSRYTTKSKTFVSTSRINHNQISSEHTEYKSSETTPEELSM